jgi:hypothetical protein
MFSRFHFELFTNVSPVGNRPGGVPWTRGNIPMSGNQLDLSSEVPSKAASAPAARSADQRKFLGVHFECCDIYTRVYINRDTTAYVGFCPKCARKIRFAVGQGGTSARFFRAS